MAAIRISITAACVTAILVVNAANAGSEPFIATSPVEMPVQVSAIAVIADPARYEGTTVSVSGLLDSKSRGAKLYATSDAYMHFDMAAGLQLISSAPIDPEQRLHGKYVVMTGTVRIEADAYPPAISLVNIERLDELPSRAISHTSSPKCIE